MTEKKRIVSGMRTTGKIHLGNYHGALKNWITLQHNYECLFFAADWHCLTTHYADKVNLKQNSLDMIIDWLAAGLDPNKCTIFIQSAVPEHAELHLLLSMMTPISWLERVPTYKDQINKLSTKDLNTYGFLGYPLLQSADILIYKANFVPVGEDQLAHIEITREIARRFNHIYGRADNFVTETTAAINKLGKKSAKLLKELARMYHQDGGETNLLKGMDLINKNANLASNEKILLSSYMAGTGKTILVEPEALLSNVNKLTGLDGQKMSKSYSNTIEIGEPLKTISTKIKTMPTDPARIKRSDPGDPLKCPVWQLHLVYSDTKSQDWVINGCKTAAIGCIDCKQLLIDFIEQEQQPMRDKQTELKQNPKIIKEILAAGCDRARKIARETLAEVKDAIGL